ncbi:aldose epimerase family protein [Pseudogracilibacillus sp. SE30717A]|uniref:aldose epimerase family protein n=1 Tax=Pseudogracilibacillus sp. SE30717A TaxID=3098293 RepID=UPI00300E5F5D
MLKITKEKINNKWYEFTLNSHSMSVSFLNFGGIITKILAPDKYGNKENIVLCYQDYAHYETNPLYLGAIIGRVAGRIKNATIQIQNTEYELDQNESCHHLHGGKKGFHNVLWDFNTFQGEDGIGVTLTYTSPDGESGYPGNVNVKVTYLLTINNEFLIEYEATTDKETVLTLTNHSYFNLSGDLKKLVLDHEVTIDSSRILKLDKDLIPFDIVEDVSETEFDFRRGRLLQEGFVSNNEQNQLVGCGYDHYFLFDQQAANKVIVADNESGRIMKIKTNQPGMVMYTANTMQEGIMLNNLKSKKYLGVCFETQASPASLWLNDLPSITLLTNETYKKQTIFSFDVIEKKK